MSRAGRLDSRWNAGATLTCAWVINMFAGLFHGVWSWQLYRHLQRDVSDGASTLPTACSGEVQVGAKPAQAVPCNAPNACVAAAVVA